MSECKKCKAPIIWLHTPRGKWMCVDEGLKPYKQNPNGKDLLFNDRGESIRCDILSEEDCKAGKVNVTGRARTPHWATCPFSESFRKPREEAD